MANLLKKRGRIFIPSLEQQMAIISGLLKLKHFDGIWYCDGTLSVRRFRDHNETPQYLPWERARLMVEAAAGLGERKPPQP